MNFDVKINSAYQRMKPVSKILISQPEPQQRSPYFSISEKYNVEIEFNPFITVERVSNKDFRKQRVDLNTFSAVIFTSRNAMDYYFQMMEEMRATISQETKYLCLSEAIALYLQKYIQYRKRKVFYANGTFTDFKVLLNKHKNNRFLLPCTDVRNDEMSNFLDGNKYNYKESVMYRTVSADVKNMDVYAYDMIIFFSPFGVQSLFDNFPDFKQGDIRIGGFGPNTCDKIEELGLRLDLKAPIPEAKSMSMVIELYLDKK